jgi:hypothetical protein
MCIVAAIGKLPGFRQQDIEHFDVAQFAVGAVDEGRDVAAQVEQVLLSTRLTRLRDRSSTQRVMRRVFLTSQTTVSGGVITSRRH